MAGTQILRMPLYIGGMCTKTTGIGVEKTWHCFVREICVFFLVIVIVVVVVVVGFLVASPRAGMQQILTHRWLQSRDRLSEDVYSKSGKMQHLQSLHTMDIYIYILAGGFTIIFHFHPENWRR